MPYLILGLPRRKCEAFESKELPSSASFSIPPPRQGAMSTVGGAGPFHVCIHQSGASPSWMGLPRTDWCSFQLTSEETWFGLPSPCCSYRACQGGAPTGIWGDNSERLCVCRALSKPQPGTRPAQVCSFNLLNLTSILILSQIPKQLERPKLQKKWMWWGKCILPFPTCVEELPPTDKKNPKALCLQVWNKSDSSLLHCSYQEYVCAVHTLPPHFYYTFCHP